MTTTNTTKATSHDQTDDVDDDIDSAARPTRRIFSTDEKLELLAGYDGCEPGTKGEFLRRAGIYSSQITEWRRGRDAGTLGAPTRTRSRKDTREIQALEKKNRRLEDELELTRLTLDIVGKAHALLEKLSKSADNG